MIFIVLQAICFSLLNIKYLEKKNFVYFLKKIIFFKIKSYTNQIIFLFSKKKNLFFNFKKKLKLNTILLKPNKISYYKQYDFFNLVTYYNNG